MGILKRVPGTFSQLFALYALALALGGCADSFTKFSPRPQRKVETFRLSGKLPSVTGGDHDLSEDGSRITVIQFASDICAVCRAETEDYIAHLKTPNREPSQVKFVSIIVGAYIEDAAYWKEDLSVPWTVLADQKNIIFQKYCAENVVPCLVVHDPSKGVVLSRNGRVSFEEVTALTGAWE